MCYLFYIAATLLLLIIISLMVYYKLLSGTALTEQIVGRNKLKYITNVFSVSTVYFCCLFIADYTGDLFRLAVIIIWQ